ncbi:MAG: hypothetical protein WB729_11300 [Candidatus Sulfotelmatobacter sp.]
MDVFISNSVAGALGHSGTYIETKNKQEEKWLAFSKENLSKISREIGGTLGDFGSIVRFYSHRNLEAIFTKWAESRHTPIGSKDFEKAMPLLPLAAGVTDEELQDRWAALLESAVTTRKGFCTHLAGRS